MKYKFFKSEVPFGEDLEGPFGEDLEGPFGYMREGDGIVVYLFNAEVDFDAMDQVTDRFYTDTIEDEDGEEVVDFAEYDPSTLYSDMAGDIQDKLSMTEVADKIKGDADNTEKFALFLRQDIWDKDIALVFINAETKEITQVLSPEQINRIVDTYKDRLKIFIREYDHVYDY